MDNDGTQQVMDKLAVALERIKGGPEKEMSRSEFSQRMKSSSLAQSDVQRNKGYKPLAIDAGMEPDRQFPGLYRDKKTPEFLRNSQGAMIEEPLCSKCNDVGLVKISPPLSRPSQGAWDHELTMCQCRDRR